MSIMTLEQYNERKTALAAAVSHAEGEFQSASFKELTGNGSPNASGKAKQHLDLLREESAKIEAAWVASQAEIERLRVKGVADSFDNKAAEIKSLLADRMQALCDVMKATEAATLALSRYEDATRQIKAMTPSLARDRPEKSATLHATISQALTIDVAFKALSGILNTAHVWPTSGVFLRDAFPNGDAVAVENQIAHNIRSAVRAAAPQPEAA